MSDTAIRDEVIETVAAMNRIWTGTWDDAAFREYIHPDAVAIVPGTPGRLSGRDAFVAGWRGFAESATIHEWRESDHEVILFARGTGAVLTYFFTIRFTLGGQEMTMRGRDMFTLAKQGGRWLILADQFSPEAEQV